MKNEEDRYFIPKELKFPKRFRFREKSKLFDFMQYVCHRSYFRKLRNTVVSPVRNGSGSQRRIDVDIDNSSIWGTKSRQVDAEIRSIDVTDVTSTQHFSLGSPPPSTRFTVALRPTPPPLRKCARNLWTPPNSVCRQHFDSNVTSPSSLSILTSTDTSKHCSKVGF